MIDVNDFYIYNMTQAQYFLDYGLCPVEVGKGRKGDMYLRFTRDSKSNKVFDLWCRRIDEINR